MFRTQGWGLVLITCLCGCEAALPTYDWDRAETAMAIMADRAGRVTTVSARCRMLLTRADGASVQLDGALAAQGRDRMRLRAWKLGQPVFDMTLTPEGLWLWRSAGGDEGPPLERLTADGVAQAWGLMVEGFETDRWDCEARDEARSLTISRAADPDGARLVCALDGRTLTVRDCVLREPDGSARFEVVLDHYRRVDEVVWPMEARASSDVGSVVIALDDVEINGDLPAQALRPPRRAEKVP